MYFNLTNPIRSDKRDTIVVVMGCDANMRNENVSVPILILCRR